MTVVALIGKPEVHAPAYGPRAWYERDNFTTEAEARGYAAFLTRMYPSTPYRIVTRHSRFVVQFVPEWRLK